MIKKPTILKYIPVEKKSLTDIFIEGILAIYDSLLPFFAGFYFAVFGSPIWLVFLFVPLLFKVRKVRRYVYN